MTEPSAPGPAMTPQRRAHSELRQTQFWIFDLDNTLYSASTGIFKQVERRMTEYVARFLDISTEQAYAVQKRYYKEFGTTMRGMMSRHDMDPAPFLEFVHAIDFSVIEPRPALDQALEALSGRKLVFTNASTAYALRILDRLGVGHHFEAVFDITAADYNPKPEPAIYETLVGRYGLDPKSTVMIEDIAHNLEPAAALGMTTVWLRHQDNQGDERDADYVHHVIDDLVDWLESVVAPEDG